jgi:hypothetical protein
MQYAASYDRVYYYYTIYYGNNKLDGDEAGADIIVLSTIKQVMWKQSRIKPVKLFNLYITW